MDANRIPTIEEIDQLAELVRHAMDDVPRVWRIASRGQSRVAYAAQVAWFHETLNALYRPFWIAYQSLRRGDRSVIEPLVRFLEADPFCFRSGYLKERFIDAITQIDLGHEQRARLTTALLDVLDKPARREFRHYVRLARYLDSPELRETLEGVQAAGGSGSRHARWILEGMAEGRGHPRFMGQGRRTGRQGPVVGRGL